MLFRDIGDSTASSTCCKVVETYIYASVPFHPKGNLLRSEDCAGHGHVPEIIFR